MVWAAAVDPRHKINDCRNNWTRGRALVQASGRQGAWCGQLPWTPGTRSMTVGTIGLEAVHWCRHLGGRAHGVGSCRGPQAQDQRL